MGLNFQLGLVQGDIKRQKEMQQLGLDLERQNKERADALAQFESAGGAQAQAARNLGLAQFDAPERRKATDTEAGLLHGLDFLKQLFSRTPARSRVQGVTGEQRFDVLQDRNLQDALLAEQARFSNEQGALKADLAAREVETATALTRLGAEEKDVARASRESEFARGLQREDVRIAESRAENRRRQSRFIEQEERLAEQFRKSNLSPAEKEQRNFEFYLNAKDEKGEPMFTPELAEMMAFGNTLADAADAQFKIESLVDRLQITKSQAESIVLQVEQQVREARGAEARIIWQDTLVRLRIDALLRDAAQDPSEDRFKKLADAQRADFQRRAVNSEKTVSRLEQELKQYERDNFRLARITARQASDPEFWEEFKIPPSDLTRFAVDDARDAYLVFVNKRNRIIGDLVQEKRQMDKWFMRRAESDLLGHGG